MKIVKNTFFNIAGYAIPGILSIPVLGYMARELGLESFGLFTLMLAVVGYASIFDVGVSRSVIREIAIFKNDENEILKIISTSALVVLFLGLIAGLLLIIFNSNIVSLLKVSYKLANDFSVSLIVIAFSIPIYLLTQIWCSLLEGREEFLKLNIYKTLSGILVVIIPVLGLFYEKSLTYTITGLLVARIISLLFILLLCKGFISSFRFHQDVFNRLISFGGWVAVSNIISPIMSYFDRFILANKVGSGLVGLYTGPSEAISKVAMIPGALARTIFPMLSNKQENHVDIKRSSYFLMSITMIPCGLLFVIFAKEIMTFWLGYEYGLHSYQIFQILMIGLIFNSIAQIPFSSIQAKGRSRTTAIIHLFELLPYLALLFYLINYYGVIGAAWAWTIRIFVDLILLMLLDRIE